jgi:hypothetical protein
LAASNAVQAGEARDSVRHFKPRPDRRERAGLQGWLSRSGRGPFRSGDDAEHGQFADGAARDEDALRVGAGIGRGEQQPRAVDQGAVVGGDAFQFVAVAEGEAQPESGDAGRLESCGAAGAPGWESSLARRPLRPSPGTRGRSRPISPVPGDAELSRRCRAVPAREISLAGFAAWRTRAPIPRQLTHDHGFTGCAHWLDCRTCWDISRWNGPLM